MRARLQWFMVLSVLVFLVFARVSSLSYAPVSGLVAWWEFNEGSGTTALDSSGNGNHGTIFNGATYVPGVSGTALQFDGADDYVEVPHSASLNVGNQITVEFWMKTTYTGRWVAITKTDGCGSTGWQSEQTPHIPNPSAIGWGVGHGSCWTIAGPNVTTSISDGLWHHVVGTYDRTLGEIKIYADGRLEGIVAGSEHQNLPLDNNEALWFGAPKWASWAGQRYQGVLDEIRIYNRVLSEAEVLARCQESAPPGVVCGSQQFTLTVIKIGSGSGTVASNPAGIDCGSTCSANFSSGTPVTLTATADANSVFIGWSGDPDCSDGVVTMDADKTCTATFNLVSRTLTVAGAGTGNGTVTGTGINCTITTGSTSGDCSETVTHGTDITLTAADGANSTFAGWTNCDSPSGNQCTMTMDADKSVTATFNLAYTLGDVNDDGKINTIDARMAQQHADGVITLTGNQFLAADVDQDSDVDSADATGIAKKGIGLPTGIPGFARGPHPRPLSVYGEGWPQAGVRWLFLAFTLPALALLRRHRRLAVLLLVGGLSVLTGCVEFAGLAPPSGAAIYLTSTSMPNGATRIIDLVVQQITMNGGVASLQGRITFPAGVAIQSLTGLNGFVVKASCGTVGDPCSSPNELRLSLVKPSAGGVSNGAVLRLAVQASGAPGQVYTLSWSGNAQAPIVLGSDTNDEITGFTTGNGQVKVR
jgi:hypothetical protein